MDPPPRRHSREVRNAKCQRECCSVQGVIYKCSHCKNAFYCSIECQRLDWPSHACATPRLHSTQTPVDELLGWMSANVRIRKDSRATTELERHGYLGCGADAHVLGTVIDGQALALKLSFHEATEEAVMHNYLYRHTHSATAARPASAVVALHTYWSARIDLRTLVLAMHPGLPIPTRDEERLVSLLESEAKLEVKVPRNVVGMHLEFMPIAVGDLWEARSTTDDQFNNIYAQLVGCLGVLQFAHFTHTDPHALNIRLIGSSARRIAYRMPSGRYYELPLRADIHPGGGINGTRAVFADCGRCTVGALNTTLSRHHSWEVPDSALHLPNVGNAGFDMWLLAVDIVRLTLPGCLPPSIVCHLVPTPWQLSALRYYLRTRNVSVHTISTLELASHAVDVWTDIDLWDKLRTVIEQEHADGSSLNLRAPWPPQFYRDPEEALFKFGLVPVARPTTTECALVEWD